MKLFTPTDQEIKEYANKSEEEKIYLPESKKLINLDDQEYKRQISDTVKKWVLGKTKSWQEKMKMIIDNERTNEGLIWQI